MPVKESHPVSFPLHHLDLKPSMSKDAKQTETNYDRISFVQHGGAAGSGHYTSYVKFNDKWFYCDDLNFKQEIPISPRNEEDIKKIADTGIDGSFVPYILFYKRQDVPDHQPTKQFENILALSKLESQLPALAQKSATAR